MAHALQNPQAPLFSAAEEAALIHQPGRAFFTINTRHPRQERMRQQAYRLDDMATVLSLLDTKIDSWMSQGEFTQPNRRVVNLKQIGLLFVDLDYYKIPGYEMVQPDSMAYRVFCLLEQAGLPTPNLIIDSGNGLQLKWLLDKPVPRQALPRWNACQRALVDALSCFGSDPQAKDASRILRVVQTTNSKARRRVEVVFAAPDNRYQFDEIADQILPIARADLEEQRKFAQKNREARQLRLIEGGLDISGLNRFSPRRLAWDRLEDLRKLAIIRGGVKEGERMKHLAWQINFLLLSGATNSNQMWHEAAALARQIDANWSYRSAELTTIFQKAKAAEAGEKVEFNGVEYSPLYTPKNQTLIDLFGIERKEESQLKTIISKAEAMRRDAERKRNARAEAGAMDRQTYQSNAEAKREQARALREQGLSIRAIADQMSVSVGAIAGYLKQG